MAQHSKRPPSSAARLVACNGSGALESLNPEEQQTEEAREGDASHYVASATLKSMKEHGQARTIAAGEVAPNGIILTDEMCEAAEGFIEHIIDRIGTDAVDRMHVEETVAAPAIHPECYGTPDVWWAAIRPNVGAYIDIQDYKYGHRRVEAFENWQLIAYSGGILSRPEFANIPRASIELRLSIYQPRNYTIPGPVREWVVTADKLIPYWTTLSAAYAASFGANPVCHVNGECQDCKGRHACDTLSQATYAAMDFASAMTPVVLPDDALGTELSMIRKAQKALDARATGLEEQALSTIRAGRRVPGFGLVSGQAREQWTKDATEVFALGEAFGVDLRNQKPITPEQARKAGVDAETIKAYSARPQGALKLSQIDDATLRRTFS